MSKLPFLMRGSEGKLDYILIALKGNVGLGLKLTAAHVGTDAFQAGFRLRSAVLSDEYVTRVTGEAPTEKFEPNQAFVANWSQVDAGRASFVTSISIPVELDITDEGSWVFNDAFNTLLTDALQEKVFGFVQVPSDALIKTTPEDLVAHMRMLVYPGLLAVWGFACEQKYHDNPKTSKLVPEGAGLSYGSTYGGGHTPTLEDSADLLDGDDDDDDDDASEYAEEPDDDEGGEKDIDVSLSPDADIKDDDGVIPFPVQNS